MTSIFKGGIDGYCGWLKYFSFLGRAGLVPVIFVL